MAAVDMRTRVHSCSVVVTTYKWGPKHTSLTHIFSPVTLRNWTPSKEQPSSWSMRLPCKLNSGFWAIVGRLNKRILIRVINKNNKHELAITNKRKSWRDVYDMWQTESRRRSAAQSVDRNRYTTPWLNTN